MTTITQDHKRNHFLQSVARNLSQVLTEELGTPMRYTQALRIVERLPYHFSYQPLPDAHQPPWERSLPSALCSPTPGEHLGRIITFTAASSDLGVTLTTHMFAAAAASRGQRKREGNHMELPLRVLLLSGETVLGAPPSPALLEALQEAPLALGEAHSTELRDFLRGRLLPTQGVHQALTLQGIQGVLPEDLLLLLLPLLQQHYDVLVVDASLGDTSRAYRQCAGACSTMLVLCVQSTSSSLGKAQEWLHSPEGQQARALGKVAVSLHLPSPREKCLPGVEVVRYLEGTPVLCAYPWSGATVMGEAVELRNPTLHLARALLPGVRSSSLF